MNRTWIIDIADIISEYSRRLTSYYELTTEDTIRLIDCIPTSLHYGDVGFIYDSFMSELDIVNGDYGGLYFIIDEIIHDLEHRLFTITGHYLKEILVMGWVDAKSIIVTRYRGLLYHVCNYD